MNKLNNYCDRESDLGSKTSSIPCIYSIVLLVYPLTYLAMMTSQRLGLVKQVLSHFGDVRILPE